MAMYIQMSNYGKHLSNRLKGREIVNSFKSELIISNKIILDFKDISLMTMSFGTELFDSIFNIVNNYENVEIKNATGNVFTVTKFCLTHVKQKEIN